MLEFHQLFGGEGGDLDDRAVQKMREVYRETDVPQFLDPTAARLLTEGREEYQRLNLDHQGIVEKDGDLFLFPWCGSPAAATLMLALKQRGLDTSVRGVMLEVHRQSVNIVEGVLRSLAASPPPDPVDLAANVGNLIRENYDPFLTHGLLSVGYASDRLLPEAVPRLAKMLLTIGQTDRLSP